MSEASFTLRYDGPALADGTIDVADLAAALIGVSQYTKAASRVVNGEKLEVSVKVKALEAGCFQINLTVIGSFLHGLTDMLTGKPATAVANLLAYATAAVGIVQMIRGRKVKTIRPSAPDRVAVELDDGTVLDLEEAPARIALDPPARAALEKVVADPLDRDGVDEVTFATPRVSAVVRQEDADAFRGVVVSGDELLETTSRMVFALVAPSFQAGNKWRVSTGRGAAFAVTIEDEDFISRVQRSEEAFSKGDFLICDVRTTARQAAGKLVTDYAVVKVVEHRAVSPPPETMI